MRQKHILFAVLNWGLGHATRSLPIIHYLIKQGHTLTIASNGPALLFLKNELPQVDFLELPNYDISYKTQKVWLAALQNGPSILKAIHQEHRMVSNWLLSHPCDLIISDCRFGCYASEKHSIIISHILQLPSSGWIDSLASKAIQKSIHKFNECWIPDLEGSKLSGQLSQAELDIPKKYIGWLSTMAHIKDEAIPSNKTKLKFDAVAIISGPEPARSEFEKKVIDQLSGLNGNFLLVSGLLEGQGISVLPPHIEHKKWVGRQELNQLLHESKVVICRTGYSSLMDLLKVGKKAILIPTPGQPEQEYLGKQLETSLWCVIQSQKNIDISTGLEKLSEVETRPSMGANFSRFRNYLAKEKV